MKKRHPNRGSSGSTRTFDCDYRPEPRRVVSLAEYFTLSIFRVRPPHRVIRYRNVIYDETKAPKMER